MPAVLIFISGQEDQEEAWDTQEDLAMKTKTREQQGVGYRTAASSLAVLQHGQLSSGFQHRLGPGKAPNLQMEGHLLCAHTRSFSYPLTGTVRRLVPNPHDRMKP